jgi:eukaryotic-like serine/threonine-protein kinase
MNADSANPSLESIFTEALERTDPAERAAFLDRACAQHPAIRERVERLLAAHDRAGGFLQAPATDVFAIAGATTDQPESTQNLEAPGTRIGPYKMLQKIGEGGMGVVYMAEQERPVRRTVALKIIKPGMDTSQVIARFEAERQALALMDHPNIAKVLDAGTTDSGRPYFVMDLVKGISFTQYCDDARLSPRERLTVFVPVCQAIQHAHQKGIIHRDIKPSNVMVTLHDGQPVPKIIDFGVAKAIDQRLTECTLFTQYGAIIGTPEYMSPEQAVISGLDVDTRSDVYSLGVLLYELLTGTTPLRRETLREAPIDEILRRIREEEPPKPSTRLSDSKDALPSISAQRHTEPARLTKLVRGELDWIVMKSLEKDRTRRYETANGLARDIQHYLDGDAVEAGPPTTSYKLRRFARKHRAALITALAFAAMLMAATIASTYLAVRATRAERVARDQADIAQAVNDFLQQDLLGQADDENQAMLGVRPDPDVKVRTLLDRASEHIPIKFTGKPLVEAAIRRTVGNSYLALGDFLSAEKNLELALEIYRHELGDEHPDTLNTMSSVGSVLQLQAPSERGWGLLTNALAGLRRVRGENHPDTLKVMYRLAGHYFYLGRLAEAEGVLVTAVDRSRNALGSYHATTLRMIGGLALTYYEEGKFAEGEPLTEEAIETCRRYWGEGYSTTLLLTGTRGMWYQARGMHAQAEDLYTRAVAGFRNLEGTAGFDTGVLTIRLASLYNDQGRTEEAERLLTEVLRDFRLVYGNDSISTLWATCVLADSYRIQGRYGETETLLSEALNGYRRIFGKNSPWTNWAAGRLADCYLGEGQIERAGRIFPEAQEASPFAGMEGTDHTIVLNTLARLRLKQRRPADAEHPARRSLAIADERFPDLWLRFDSLSLLGGAISGQNKYTEAEPMLINGYEGLREREARIPFLRRKTLPAEAGARIVELYEAWGKKDKAAEWRKRLAAEQSERPSKTKA